MLFTADLVSKHETLLQSIFTESDVNSKLSILNDALLSTLQTHAPVKTIRVRNRPCPYITQVSKYKGFDGTQRSTSQAIQIFT
jgi:hypothetical protein